MNRENTIKGTMATRASGTVFQKPLLKDAVPKFEGVGGGKRDDKPPSPGSVKRVLKGSNYPYGAKSTQALGKRRE